MIYPHNHGSERIDFIVYSPLFVVNQTLIEEKGSHCQSAVVQQADATQDSTLVQNAQTRRRKTTIKEQLAAPSLLFLA